MGPSNGRNKKESSKKSSDKRFVSPKYRYEKPKMSKEIKKIILPSLEESKKFHNFEVKFSNTLLISNSGKFEKEEQRLPSNLPLEPISHKASPIMSNMHFKIDDEKSSAEKWEKLKVQMEKYRISWTEGCDKINVSRDKIIEETMSQIEFIDLHKELKINFINEISNDAGGMIREWISLIINELQSPNYDILEKCDTEEYFYKIKRNPIDRERSELFFYFLGKIIGKGIFEKINFNLCFSPVIYKSILNESILLEDMKNFDSQIYESLLYIKDNSCEGMDLFFEDNGEEFEPGSSKVLVTEENKSFFIDVKIQFLCSFCINNQIMALRNGILSVVHAEDLNLLNSADLELIIMGKGIISVEEWKSETVYKGVFTKSHSVIVWFWNLLESYNQEQLRKILKFSTGSTRIPIGGFKKLESNRNTVSKFCIEPLPILAKGKLILPLSHTCFNRLCLPIYASFLDLKNAFDYIINNDISEFAIE